VLLDVAARVKEVGLGVSSSVSRRPDAARAVRRRSQFGQVAEADEQEGRVRIRITALTVMVLVLAGGCAGRLGAGTVDAARAACLEAARNKGDQPIETYDVRSLGDGRYQMSVRNKGTLGSSTTTCTYDKNIGAAIR
jgi:hypothetical protein